ncbi:MAG: Uma2 family endonuclease [Verrucomicrobiota bacterium]
MLKRTAGHRNSGTDLLTAEDFLQRVGPGEFADLIAGEIYHHTPSRLTHARLVSFLDHLLALYLARQKSGSEVYRGSFPVRLSLRDMFMPDLAYYTKRQTGMFVMTHAPAPTMVVEVLSDLSYYNDTSRKFVAYELHGVEEYWVLDPDQLKHRFYRRRGEELVEFATGQARIDAWSIPGFWVKRSWLNPDKLPSETSALEEILSGRKTVRRKDRTLLSF